MPGYAAPPATIAPAARVSSLLLGILADAASQPLPAALADGDLADGDRQALAPVRSLVPPEVPDALLQQGLMAWAALFGTVSFELFGQLHTVVGEQAGDRDAFFAGCVRRWATQIGLTPDHARPSAQEHEYGLEPVME